MPVVRCVSKFLHLNAKCRACMVLHTSYHGVAITVRPYLLYALHSQ